MQGWWQVLLENLWPSRSAPPESLRRREAMLRSAIAMGVIAAAGPEVVAALEMTTLLELLGASLFVAAFQAGAKLALMRFWEVLCAIALPAPQVAIVRSDARPLAKAAALTYVSAHVAWCLMFAIIIGAWGHHIFQGIV